MAEQGEKTADSKLPGARVRHEIRLVRRGGGEEHTCRQRRTSDHRERDQHPPTDGGAAGETRSDEGCGDHQDGPDQIELLLDRERPVVLCDAGRVVQCRVIDRHRREEPVLHIERTGCDLQSVPFPARVWEEDHDKYSGHEEDQERRRQQAPDASRIERAQSDMTSPRDLVEQVACDQEAGDDEEHIHADVPASHAGRPQVIEDDRGDGECPQRLDVGAEGTSRRGRRGGSCRDLAGHGCSVRGAIVERTVRHGSWPAPEEIRPHPREPHSAPGPSVGVAVTCHLKDTRTLPCQG